MIMPDLLNLWISINVNQHIKKPNNELATVYAENGMHFVMIKGAIKIPSIVKTIVTDDFKNDYAKVEITLDCNIVQNYSQALAIYKPKEE